MPCPGVRRALQWVPRGPGAQREAPPVETTGAADTSPPRAHRDQ